MNTFLSSLYSTKRLFFVALIVLSPIIAAAQTYKISGQVIDLQEFAPVHAASVALLRQDSTAVKAVLTNENGEYTILVDNKKADYILRFSFLGFKTQYKNAHVSGKSTQMQTVRLEQDSQLLDNVNVTGNLPKVQAVEDTLLYNADAYRLPEGSVLEELIERLPGAEVTEDGKVTINGREIKKILLDGKEFFVGDMNTALKNIPTSIIDKLKHYDEKSDMAKVTGIDDGQEKAVIDVRVKKGMNRGYNVNTDLAYGTEDRYSAKINANEFQQNMKLSFVTNMNNANDRSTPNRAGNGRGGGGEGNGLRTVKTIGANINYDDRKKIQADGNVRWNHNNNNRISRSSSESFVSKTGAFSNSSSTSDTRNNGWNGEFRVEWKPTQDWNILVRPTMSYSTNDRIQQSVNASFNEDPYLYVADPLAPDADFGEGHGIRVNSRKNTSLSYSESKNANLSVQVNRKFGTGGRNLTFRTDGSYNSSESNSVSNNYVHLFKKKDINGNDSTYYTNRYNDAPNKTKSYAMQVTYSEPIIKNTFLQLSYRFQYRNNFSDRKTYDFSSLREAFGAGIQPGYRMIDEYLASASGLVDIDSCLSKSLSRYSEYVNYTHDVNFTFRMVREHYNLSVGARYNAVRSHFKQDHLGRFVDTIRTTANISPTMTFRYRFSRQHTLNMDYHGQQQEPSITQLLDITDDSNPLNISKGNPGLKPAFTNTFNARYNNYIVTRRQSIAANLNYSTTSNSISNKVTYNDETGGRVTQPENINGNWNFGGNFQFTSALDSASNWNLSTTTDMRYNHYVAYVSLNRQADSEKNVTKTTTLSERLSISYRNSWLEVETHGRVNYTKADNLLQTSGNRETWNYSYGCSFNIKCPWGTIFDTSLNQTSRRGYNDASFNTNELIWNAQISQELMSKKRLMLTLQIYDILKQQSNFSRQLSANRRSDTWYNAINSYAMLHLVWQIRNFGGKAGRQAMRNRARMGEDAFGNRDDDGFGQGGSRDNRGGGFGGGNRNGSNRGGRR